MLISSLQLLIGDDCISLISLFSLIDGFGSVIMHFRCKLGMGITTLKQIANIKEFYTSQLVFFDLMLFCVTGVKGGKIDYMTLVRLF